MEVTFNEKLSALIKNKNYNCVYMDEARYNNIIKEVCEAKNKTRHKSDKDYRRLHRYDVIVVRNEKKLISPLNEKNFNIRYFVSVEKLFDIIHKAHLTTGHGGRNRMIKEINEHYKNVTVDSIMIYLSLCEPCQKKAKNKKRGLIVKPILSSEQNSRCQVDLIDLQTQPDEGYKFVLNYQDYLTKFVILKPLKTKSAAEIANNLMEIFTTFGAPSILQSNNGREFVNKIISELINLWDGIKIIHGKARHSQSQGSVERANQDVKNMIFNWMESSKSTKWSEGLKYVQLLKNKSFHDEIKQTPYEALFGSKIKLGLKSSSFPSHLVDAIHSEEELADMLSTANSTNLTLHSAEDTCNVGSGTETLNLNQLQNFPEECTIQVAENNENHVGAGNLVVRQKCKSGKEKSIADSQLIESRNVTQKNDKISVISLVSDRKVLIQKTRHKARDIVSVQGKKMRIDRSTTRVAKAIKLLST